MPGGDGTGPDGNGPMTGMGAGFCVLRSDEKEPGVVKGFAGTHGVPVRMVWNNTRKEGSNMPAGDGTGPMGMGPMTGRAAGFCAGYGAPGYMSPIPGRGFRLRQGYGGQVGMGFGRGGGRGGGRGWRNMFFATGLTGWQRAAAGWPMAGGVSPYAAPYAGPTKEQELEALKGQAEYFETALGDIRKRLQELEAEKTDK